MGSGTPSGIGSDSSTGAPVFLTDPNAVASKAGAEAQKGAEQLGKDVNTSEQDLNKGITADTGSVTGTKIGITQYIGNLVCDVLPIVPRGVGAVVLIGLGIWLIARTNPTPKAT